VAPFPDRPWYPPSVPLPAEGIRARSRRGRIGESWWSARFVAVLESFGMGARLARGKRYARSGQVLDLEVRPGVVGASVQGSRRKPYAVEIRAATLTEAEWARVELAMAAEARFMAALLAGEMPQEIEEAFTGCELSLFPATRRDIRTECSCPDWANPCKHVAAALFILAERFDDDPFLILAWRGRAKAQLVERLRELRAAHPSLAVPGEAVPALGDAPAAPPLEELLDTFWIGGSLPPGPVPRAPDEPDLVLRELGPPPAEAGGSALLRALAPMYRAMAADAERRALERGGEAGVEDAPAVGERRPAGTGRARTGVAARPQRRGKGARRGGRQGGVRGSR
jgi:uncharacterized Zn finger protein